MRLNVWDHLLLRALTILLCLWLWFHLRPQSLIQLVTPTETVVKTVEKLPDIAGMRAPR